MMNKKQYCQRLLEHRDDHMPLLLFLFGKWIFLKVVLIAMGAFLLLSPSVGTKILGALAIGYALGKIAAGVMSYRVSRTTWQFTCDLLDWDRVSEIATEQDGESQEH
jgi:hypothetical protein